MSDGDSDASYQRAARRRRRRRLAALVALGVLVLAAGAYGVQVWRYWDRHVSTDDAFVEAHVSPVSARVRGTVVEVLVRDNQEVRGGRAAGAPGPAGPRGEGPPGPRGAGDGARAACAWPPPACR